MYNMLRQPSLCLDRLDGLMAVPDLHTHRHEHRLVNDEQSPSGQANVSPCEAGQEN